MAWIQQQRTYIKSPGNYRSAFQWSLSAGAISGCLMAVEMLGAQGTELGTSILRVTWVLCVVGTVVLVNRSTFVVVERLKRIALCFVTSVIVKVAVAATIVALSM